MIKPIKIAVISYIGDVGKSTITSFIKHYFDKSDNGIETSVISVESINSDLANTGTTKLNSDEIMDINTEMLINYDKNVLIDIGHSNIEPFMERVESMPKLIESIDLYLVVCHSEAKGLNDTENLIDRLKKIGIPKNKIMTFLNKVNPKKIDDDFYGLQQKSIKDKSFIFNKKLSLARTDIIDYISVIGLTVPSLIANDDISREAVPVLNEKLKADAGISSDDRRQKLIEFSKLISAKEVAEEILKDFEDSYKEIMKVCQSN